MIRTVSVETMRRSDAWTIANKVSSKELMYRAGKGIFEAAAWKAPVGIVCGKGNNAGDGFVVAQLLHNAGIDCTIFLLSEAFSEDGKYYYDICASAGIPTVSFTEETDFRGYGSLLDCLFGTGFSGVPVGMYEKAIRAINASGAWVVSADINSGLNGDSGAGSVYVKSDLTVSIGEYKPGHFLGQAARAMKEKVNVDIGIEIQGDYIWLEEDGLQRKKCIKGLHHVSLRCEGVEQFRQARDFYHNILGLELKRSWGEGEDAGAMLDAGNCVIELFAKGRELDKTGSINHLAFAAADTDECIARVRAAGYPVTKEPTDVVIPSKPPLPARVAFCIGPVGEEIEFFEEAQS